MSYSSRDYAADGLQYRGYVREEGERMREEWVWDETPEEVETRAAAWREANPGEPYWRAPNRSRRGHHEDRGLEPYERVRTYGPYATIGPAKRAAGTGNGVRKVTTGKLSGGGHFVRVAEVHVGTVEWRLPE
jgi:hypothetical protein